MHFNISALFNQYDLIALRTGRNIQKLMPGLTGWAQINGRYELPIPQKVAVEVEYMENRSFLFDMKILWLTFLRKRCRGQVFTIS
ncbi:MAG: sugar transferase [Colwellia sp.]|nr:sugar transferase [Colwellia sp.]